MKKNVEQIKIILEETIETYKDNPVDLLNIDASKIEYNHINNMKFTYLRTIYDIVSYYNQHNIYNFNNMKVLELGAFLGVVSICLAKLGFQVTSSDVPEFLNNKNILKRYKENNIEYLPVNLKRYKLPLDASNYDVVIMCETLEHLNFNPLPMFLEINRILKTQGILYLSLPNIADFHNRRVLLQGRSIHNPIKDFFAQLDKSHMINGIHWREYTMGEIKEMLEKLGFAVKQQYFFSSLERKPFFELNWKQLILKIITDLIPTLKENITTIALKIKYPDLNFYFCDANSSDVDVS
ncbi:MAG: class I SAM-dependent methyltransferase [Candidatus Eremiobacterota bacterium]